MSYYNRYRNRRRPDGSMGGPGMGTNTDNIPSAMGLGMGSPPDVVFDLGKNKRVTVRRFRNVNLIDIREYYIDKNTGDMCPGKKGISLTEDLYDELLKHRLNIDDALRRFGSKRPRTKTIRILSDDEDDDDSSSSNSNNNSDNENSKKKKRKLSSSSSSSSKKKDADNKERDRDSSKRSDSKGDKKKHDILGGSGGNGSGSGSSGSGDKEERKIKPVLKRERETEMVDGEEIEIQPRKQKVAPPTLLPHEENIENAKREANATLIIPGANANRTQSSEDKDSAGTRKAERTKHNRAAHDDDPNSSDGGSIEAEMNKILNEPSDEEF